MLFTKGIDSERLSYSSKVTELIRSHRTESLICLPPKPSLLTMMFFTISFFLKKVNLINIKNITETLNFVQASKVYGYANMEIFDLT